MRHHGFRAVVGGILGTAAAVVVVRPLGVWVIGRPLDPVQVAAGLLGIPSTAAALALGAIGGLLVPLLYLATASRLDTRPALRGLLYAAGLWIFVEAVVMTAAGGGPFHRVSGGWPAALASGAGHALYGLVLGGVAGRRQVPERVVAESPLRGLDNARADAQAAERLTRPRPRPSDREAWRS